jgi:hypothetical protein
MTRPLLALTIAAIAVTAVAHRGDPIADDVARWKRFLAADTITVGFMSELKSAVTPALTSADDALAKGRRSLALLRLGSVRSNLQPGLATRADVTYQDIDAERAKLAPRFAPAAIAAVANAKNTSALGRAFAQSSAMQARETFDASLVYGRATEPLFGDYYLQQGVAYLDYAEFAAKAAASLGQGKAPTLRSLAPDIHRLRDEMLAAYRPPLSIDRHSEFIGASSATKEALEYDAAGDHEAALLRYLQAAVRFASLRADLKPLDKAALAAQMDKARKDLADSRTDHSIGTLFLEVAESDGDSTRTIASAVVEDVLPRYFAALQPARAVETRQPPELTVTLVRWPYT